MTQEYLTYLRDNRNLTANTLDAYANDIRQFVIWASGHQLRWSTIKQEDIENYLAEQHRNGIAATSINRKTASIRGLFTWAYRRGKLTSNPARWIRAQKTETKLPQTANRDELTKYLSTPATTDRARIIHALVALLMDTGIRIQEAIDLKTTDVDTKNMTMKIHGKGRKERTVYYTQLTMEHCCKTGNWRMGYLIPIADQRRLRFMLYSELKGMDIHPHAIRHMFATDMLQNGADITAISKLLGHATVKTTERYTAISDNKTREQYALYH